LLPIGGGSDLSLEKREETSHKEVRTAGPFGSDRGEEKPLEDVSDPPLKREKKKPSESGRGLGAEENRAFFHQKEKKKRITQLGGSLRPAPTLAKSLSRRGKKGPHVK